MSKQKEHSRPKSEPDSSASKRLQDQAGDVKDKAIANVKEAASDISAEAAKTAERAKQAAVETGEAIKQKTFEITEKAKQQGKQKLKEQKLKLVDELSSVRLSVNDAAKKLQTESDSGIGYYVGALGEQLGRAEEHLKNRDLGQLLHDVEDFAKKRPEMFFGGLFAAGLVASRFFKATKRNARQRRDSQQYAQRNSSQGNSHQGSSQ